MNVKVTNMDNGSVVIVSENNFLKAKTFFCENSSYEYTEEEVTTANEMAYERNDVM